MSVTSARPSYARGRKLNYTCSGVEREKKSLVGVRHGQHGVPTQTACGRILMKQRDWEFDFLLHPEITRVLLCVYFGIHVTPSLSLSLCLTHTHTVHTHWTNPEAPAPPPLLLPFLTFSQFLQWSHLSPCCCPVPRLFCVSSRLAHMNTQQTKPFSFNHLKNALDMLRKNMTSDLFCRWYF